MSKTFSSIILLLICFAVFLMVQEKQIPSQNILRYVRRYTLVNVSGESEFYGTMNNIYIF